MIDRGSHLGRQRAFHFDQRWCIACRACQIACKDLHNLPVGVNWRRVVTLEVGVFPRPLVFHLSLSCNHCARPACAEACPVGAITKRAEDGVVILDRSLCTGCRTCEDACPYGALQYDPSTRLVSKCDMCVDLLACGEEPACVAACTMRTVRVGWLDEMDVGDEPSGVGLPDPSLTRPSLRIHAHRDACPSAADRRG